MSSLWIYGLPSLLSIAAYVGISSSGAGQPPPDMPAVESVPVSVPAPATSGSSAAENFAEYIHLHRTRGEAISLPVAARVRACTE